MTLGEAGAAVHPHRMRILPRLPTRALALAVFASIAWLGTPASADQRDSRLPTLFNRLAAAPDGESAAVIRSAIWAIWYESADPTITELMERAETAIAKEQYAVALAAYDAIIATDPGFAEGWNRRATLNFIMGRFPQSLADIDETLKREPRHFGALSGLGQIRAIMGDFDAAIEAYRAAMAIYPGLPGGAETIALLRRRRANSTP